jgi:hypothetical protein
VSGRRGRRRTAAERARISAGCRAAWAAGKWAQRAKPRFWHAWLPPHDARLRAWAGVLPADEIAARLTAEFDVPRTPTAVRVRLRRLGLSQQLVHYTAQQVGYLFGVAGKTVTASWVRRGWLVGRQLTAQAGSAWVFTAADVEQFIRAHSHAVDWRRMPPSRWRALAEVDWRRDPWLTVPEAAWMSGVAASTLRNHLAAGWLVGARRFAKGGAHAGAWLVRRSALRQFAYRRPELVGVSGRPTRRSSSRPTSREERIA